MIHHPDEQDLRPENLSLVVEELRKSVSMAEATLGQKETENMALREQVKQYEARWSEYEARMKSMEEMWQKQIASLQVSFPVVTTFWVDYKNHKKSNEKFKALRNISYTNSHPLSLGR